MQVSLYIVTLFVSDVDIIWEMRQTVHISVDKITARFIAILVMGTSYRVTRPLLGQSSKKVFEECFQRFFIAPCVMGALRAA